MGRYFLLTYPSLWGMGSDTDIYMVSEEKLRDLIEFEVTQLRKGDRFASERLTGTWSDEKFCDSNDMEEVIQDVMSKRMTKSSTYSNCNDLILVPDYVPMFIREENLGSTIVTVLNQYGYDRDIIFESGHFTQYELDLTDVVRVGQNRPPRVA